MAFEYLVYTEAEAALGKHYTLSSISQETWITYRQLDWRREPGMLSTFVKRHKVGVENQTRT
jgi:hypothetical protein